MAAAVNGARLNGLMTTQQVVDGVKEEMLAVMMGMMQTAAEACAEVCARRLQEQHEQMLSDFQQEGEGGRAGPLEIPVGPKKRTSFYQIEEVEATPKNTEVQVGLANAHDIEAMYDDLENSMEGVRLLAEARRQELEEIGCIDCDDDDALDRELLRARGQGAGGGADVCAGGGQGAGGEADSRGEGPDVGPVSLRDEGIFGSDDEEEIDVVLSRRGSLVAEDSINAMNEACALAAASAQLEKLVDARNQEAGHADSNFGHVADS
mmetsp:Transcript_62683/g.176755  ORF Transcript_62683/g.176755 Transcript_62683/m.176755 type:complete len:264 (+) Transcript_62683:97-888(+)